MSPKRKQRLRRKTRTKRRRNVTKRRIKKTRKKRKRRTRRRIQTPTEEFRTSSCPTLKGGKTHFLSLYI
jgi:hypothetical protein